MKIIHLVLGKANPNRMNGVNKVAHQLATTQINLGHEVMLWGIANNLMHDYPERVYKTALFQQIKNKMSLDPNLIAAIDALPKDTLVHFHGAFIPEFAKVSNALHKRGVAYVYTPHGSLTEGALMKSKWKKKMYIMLLEANLIKKAKAVQLLGINEYNYLDNIVKIDHKHLIANGQNLNEIPDITTFTLKKHEHPLFGFCGRIDRYHKGLDLLLDGFKLYLDAGNKGHVSLIGDGADKDFLIDKAEKLNISEYLTFHGKKFGQEKFELLANMDVFMHTSRMEGFPTAVLEAAALHKPCITSEATNINPYIDKYEAGFTLKENNPSTIAQTMQMAANDFYAGKLSHKGARAFEMVKKEFNWTKIAKQLVDVYKNALTA